MNVRCVFSLILSVWLVSCGASSNSLVTDDSMPAPAAGQAKAPGGNVEQKPDSQAEEASRYCELQVRKSQSVPVEVLNKKQIAACLTAVRPQLRTDCGKGAKRQVILKIIIASDGHVIGAFPVGDGADSDEASCVAEKVKPVVFPAFVGKEQLVIEKYPFDMNP